MDKNDYVSFEVAKLLKEKGFKEPSNGIYRKMYIDKEEELSLYTGKWKYDEYSENILAPSLYDVQKWLREKHKIDVLITFDVDDETKKPLGYSFDIWQNSKFMDFCMEFDTYEEALNEGIKRALKYI